MGPRRAAYRPYLPGTISRAQLIIPLINAAAPAATGALPTDYRTYGSEGDRRGGRHVVFVSEGCKRAFEAVLPDNRLASSRVIYPAIPRRYRAARH